MSIIKLAWDNLFFNKTRTILNMILIIVAFVALMLISGYNNYVRKGIIMSITEGSGALSIADKSYWDINSKKIVMLKSDDFSKLYKKLDSIEDVTGYQKKLDVNGLIGTESKSGFFSGTAYEKVSRIMKGVVLKNGTSLSDDDTDAMILGVTLGEYLNVDYNKAPYLSLMSDFGDGISLGSLKAVGGISLHNTEADKMSVIFPLKAVYNAFGLDDGEAHNLLVYLKDYNKAYDVKKELNDYFISNNLHYEAKDWRELNGFILSVIDMNNNNYFMAMLILSILVFVSIMQTLTTNFLERLSEFGTMRAIGISIKNLTALLFLEIILLVFISSIIGTIISYGGSLVLKVMDFTLKYPGATDGFHLSLLLSLKDTVSIFLWILIVSILAGIYPIVKVIKLPIIEVIKYV